MKKMILIAVFLLWPGISFGAVVTFGNYDPIAINNPGPASPYPSTINVSGLSNTILTDVNVTLLGLSHTWPDDLHVALVGPTGASVVLMANSGDRDDIDNAFLTFDNEAPSPLPGFSQIVSGIYQVSQHGFEITQPNFTFGTDLSIFDGLDPNGIWSLYVYDDSSGDFGSISSGWTLSLETTPVPIPAAAWLFGSGLLGFIGLAKRKKAV